MKVGKHTAFMIDFVSQFADGEISRFDFEMDYSGYVIEHFHGMQRENAHLAQRFAETIDNAVEYAENHVVSDDDFKIMISDALCDFLDEKPLY